MTTYTACFKQAPSESDSTSLDGADMFYWGLNGKDGSIPLRFGVQNIINKTSKMGQTSFDLSYGNKKTEIQIPTVPLINGLPFYAVEGLSTEVTPDTRRTISQLTTSRKPRYHNAVQLNALDPQVRYGSFMNMLRVSHSKGEAVQFSMQGIGCKPDRAAATFNSITYPSSEDKPFDVTDYVKIGADGAEETVAFDLVEYAAVQEVNAYVGANGYPEYICDFANIDTYLSITLEGEQNTILDYAEDQTKVSVLWKFHKSAASTRYIEIDSQGATACIESMIPITLQNGQVIGWNNIFKLEKPLKDVKDYLDSDFYTIPSP